MTSPEWDVLYREGKQLSRWPWSDVVSLVFRHARPEDGFRRVLELGCGAGANIPLFVKLGVDYYAIEGSPSMVDLLRVQFPDLKDRIVAGDFAQDIPFGGAFDLVVDRSAVTHNTTRAIRQTLAGVRDHLRRGGKFIGVDWHSRECPDAELGEPLDEHTRTNIHSAAFAGVGATHFSDRDHLTALLDDAGLQLEWLDHKRIDHVIPAGRTQGAWDFVAVKQ